MKKRAYPSLGQANLAFLIVTIAILFSSIVLVRMKIGAGIEGCINELIFLFPVILLATFNKWKIKQVFRINKISKRNGIISITIGIGLWLFCVFIANIVGIILNSKIGKININNPSSKLANNPIQIVLLIIALVIFAPICEELLFRGLILRAYEGFNKKYGFIIVGILFGLLHSLNGISSIIPVCINGIMLGYLVNKTNSLYTSIIQHSTYNFCAIFLNIALGVPQMTNNIPIWFSITAILGLIIAIILAKFTIDDRSAEVNNTYILCEEDNKTSILSKTFLIIPMLLFFAVSCLDIYLRTRGK